MRQGGIPYTTQIIDMKMDQQRDRGYFPTEPSSSSSSLFGNISSFPQPHNHAVIRPSMNSSNINTQHLHDHYDSSMFYGTTRLNGVQQAASSYYYNYMGPPSSSGFLPTGISLHEVRDGPCKRKLVDWIPGSTHYFTGLAGSSSFGFPPGPQRSFGNGPSPSRLDLVGPHDHNNGLTLGRYMGQQPVHPALGSFWFEQRIEGPSGDIGASSWAQANAMPYMQGNGNGGAFETVNMAMWRYNNETSTGPLSGHPTINHRQNHSHHHHHPHHPSLAVPGGSGGAHNMNFHPQMAPAPYRYPLQSPQTTTNPSYSGLIEIGHNRQQGPAPSTGLRIDWPHHFVHGAADSALRHHDDLPHLRVLQDDEVALLDIPEFYEDGHLVDHHSDLRMDIEDMSYEELLELGEQIGKVSTGLSEESIINQLKMRNYISPTKAIDLEEGSCIICQDGYQDEEKIGTLNCGHEYHAVCLKTWLVIKNICPVCKSKALAIEEEDF